MNPPSNFFFLSSNLCIFCAKDRKKYKGNIIDIGKCETFDAEVTIRNAAKYLKDETLLANIGSYEFRNGPDFEAMEAKYHHVCKGEYTNKATDAKNSEKLNLSPEKKEKSAALNDIVALVNKCVVEKKSLTEVSQLLDRYKRVYITEGGKQDKIKSYTNQRLVNKLRKHFDSTVLNIMSDSTNKFLAWKKGDMSFNVTSCLAKENFKKSNDFLWDYAVMLRNKILQSWSNPLEEPLTVEEIMRGEVDAGPSGDLSSRKERLVNSTSADVVYACSGGKLLPSKHISLRVALKSMTGSKPIVSLLNRFEHCVSNEKVPRIDIGMESSLTTSNGLVPDQINRAPELYTALTWDNFDVNHETLPGADSVHHTSGICYQDILPTIQIP